MLPEVSLNKEFMVPSHLFLLRLILPMTLPHLVPRLELVFHLVCLVPCHMEIQPWLTMDSINSTWGNTKVASAIIMAMDNLVVLHRLVLDTNKSWVKIKAMALLITKIILSNPHTKRPGLGDTTRIVAGTAAATITTTAINIKTSTIPKVMEDNHTAWATMVTILTNVVAMSLVVWEIHMECNKVCILVVSKMTTNKSTRREDAGITACSNSNKVPPNLDNKVSDFKDKATLLHRVVAGRIAKVAVGVVVHPAGREITTKLSSLVN
mmetsp:Transcript_52904/g.154149  ORF Transcript_52904/g.154149 Transcript_52904/m.154149 type:complete len:266 (-) Transcript_52904:82-879(-)